MAPVELTEENLKAIEDEKIRAEAERMRLEREEKKRNEEEERKAEEERKKMEQARLQMIIEVRSCSSLQSFPRVTPKSLSLDCNFFLFDCCPGNTRRHP